MALPASPQALSTAWLSQALDRRVASFTTSDVEQAGVNGDVRVLRLTLDDAEVLRLVAKFPPAEPRARQMVAAMGWSTREARFYRELAPDSPLTPPDLCRFAAVDVSSFTRRPSA